MATSERIKPEDVLWRVEGPHGEGVTVTVRPIQQLYRTDGTTFLGGRIKRVGASDLDVEVIEGGMRRTITAQRALAPAAIVGDPCCAEVTGGGITTYTITAIHPSRFLPGEDRNPLAIGIVPSALGGPSVL